MSLKSIFGNLFGYPFDTLNNENVQINLWKTGF